MNMIKQVFALVVLFATAVFAGQNDALLAFSTKGPDAYADGTPVMVGEVYALVWMRNGFEFQGVDLNGQAVDAENNAVVVAMPLAKARKDGTVHCPLTLFQLDETFAAAHADGQFALALLDTRVADGKGGLTVSGRGEGALRVQGWGLVSDSRIKAVGASLASATNAGAEGTASLAKSAIPAGLNLPQPQITSFQVKDGFATLTVKGTSDQLLYNVASGSEPDRRDVTHAAETAVQGSARAAGEITLTVPMTAGQNFFKVVRN